MHQFHLVTFGCQMNHHDSDRIAGVLQRAGHRAAPDLSSADLVVLNTCSVREKAEQKLRSEVGRLGLLKRERPELVLAVAGCLAQQEGEALIRRLPQIDIVFGPDNAAELPRLLAEVASGGLPQVQTEFDLNAPQFLAPSPARRAPVSAYVTTMKGCDERCTFCIVPTTRGPERYRPSSQILAEIDQLVADGAREVTLLGQTVDSYLDPEGALCGPAKMPAPALGRARRRSADESQFPALLRAIAERSPGLRRLRYTSPHPRHLTSALVAAHRDLPLLCQHVHMPVQSGSDRLLRRMLRRYSVEEYRQRLASLRAAVPGLTLSTDIIVGFPGETEEDFQLTLELVRSIGFVGVFGFKYSPRPGTPALRLGDDVTEAVKSERLSRLFELSEAQRYAHLQTLVGQTVEVLVEGRDRRGSWTGRSRRNEIVHFEATGQPEGELLQVRVERANKHSLSGEPVDADWAPSARAPQPMPPSQDLGGRRSLPVLA